MDENFLSLLRKTNVRDEVTLQSIAAWNNQKGKDLLTELLTSTDKPLRRKAAIALANIDASRALDIFIAKLSDPSIDDDLKLLIYSLLGDIPDHRSVQILGEVAQNDPDISNRWAAVYGLGRIGDADVIPILEHIAQHDTGVNYEGDPISLLAKESIEEIQTRLLSSS